MAGESLPGTSSMERYAMKDDSTITGLKQPGSIIDPLTEIARDGARRMLALALKSEVDEFLALHSEERLEDGLTTRKCVLRTLRVNA